MAWDQTQKQFACCGVHNHTDWNTPPDSCCIHVIPGCGRIERNLQPSGANSIAIHAILYFCQKKTRGNAELVYGKGERASCAMFFYVLGLKPDCGYLQLTSGNGPLSSKL